MDIASLIYIMKFVAEAFSNQIFINLIGSGGSFVYCFIRAVFPPSFTTYSEFRQELQLAHDRLQQLILEMLRITIATEEEIRRRLGICAERDFTGSNPPSRTPSGNHDAQETGLALIQC